MQKILQIEFFKTALVGSIVGILQLCAAFYYVNLIGWNGNGDIFIIFNVCVWIFSFVGLFQRKSLLPKYFFIAPISKKQRENAVKKIIIIRWSVFVAAVSLFGILPLFFYAIYKKYEFTPYICFVEIVVINAVTVSSIFYRNAEITKNVKDEFWLFFLPLLLINTFAGIENCSFEKTSMYIVDVIYGGIIALVGLGFILIGFRKYFKSIIHYYSNYELIKQKHSESQKDAPAWR